MYCGIKSKKDIDTNIFIRILMIILNIPVILYAGFSVTLLVWFFDSVWNNKWI